MADPQTIALYNPNGELGDVPIEQAQEALANGFKIAPPADVHESNLQQQYGVGTGNALKTVGEGAARGISFGLSDQLLTKSGLDSPEALSERAKRHPILAPASELAGGLAGLVIAPEAETAGPALEALNAAKASGDAGAIADATKAYQAAKTTLEGTDALNPVSGLSKVAKKISLGVEGGIPPATSTTSKILSQAGAGALGSAVEGAAYGLGHSVTEDALGDPSLNGERVMANVGYGSLLGGALGGIFGAVTPAFHPQMEAGTLGADAGSQDAAVAGAAGSDSSLGEQSALRGQGSVPGQNEGVLAGLRREKANAPEIRQAAADIGAPVLEGMVSDSKPIQRAEDLLTKGNSSIAYQRQQAYQKVYESANEAVDASLGKHSGMSIAETGDAIRDSIGNKMKDAYQPVKQAFQEVDESLPHIQIHPEDRAAVLDELNAASDPAPGTDRAKFKDSFGKMLESAQNGEHLNNVRTEAGLESSGSTLYNDLKGHINKAVDDLHLRAITRAAKDLPEGAERDYAMGLVDKIKTNRKSYAAFMEPLNDIADAAGIGRFRGFQDFMNKWNEKPAEAIAGRLFSKNNSAALKTLQERFPDEATMLARLQKNKLIDAADQTTRNPALTIIKKVDKLEPEIKRFLFSPAELKRIESARTVLKSLPHDFNPSHTATAHSTLSFFQNPAAAASQTVRDGAMLAFIKNLGPQADAHVQALSTIERMTQKTAKQIQTGAKAVFSEAGETLGKAAGMTGGFAAGKFDDHNQTKTQLQELNSDPESLIDKIDVATRNLHGVAPKTAEQVQMAATRATQYLASVLPQSPQQGPLSKKFPDSPADIAKFNRSREAVEDPTSILGHLRNGTISVDAVNAVKAVYPQMYQEMSAALTDHLTSVMGKGKLDKMPYSTKLGLSMFLGNDLVDSLNQQTMALMQSALKPQAPGGQGAKAPQAGLNKLTGSERLQTATQSVSQRQT